MNDPNSLVIVFLMFSNKYHYILLNYTLTLLHKCLGHYVGVLFISLMQSVNGAEF